MKVTGLLYHHQILLEYVAVFFFSFLSSGQKGKATVKSFRLGIAKVMCFPQPSTSMSTE